MTLPLFRATATPSTFSGQYHIQKIIHKRDGQCEEPEDTNFPLSKLGSTPITFEGDTFVCRTLEKELQDKFQVFSSPKENESGLLLTGGEYEKANTLSDDTWLDPDSAYRKYFKELFSKAEHHLTLYYNNRSELWKVKVDS